MTEWKQYLYENFHDQDHPLWDISSFNRNNELFNTKYVVKLSGLTKECKSDFFLVSVGACDGTSDQVIEQFYSREHWKGVFVEAYQPNVVVLEQKIKEKDAGARSLVLPVAAMEECVNSTVMLRSPTADVNNAKVPHWLRRQSSSVPTPEELAKNRKFKKVWKITEVCLL